MLAAVAPLSTLVLLAAAAVYVRADPNPNNPGPGDVFNVGQPCPIGWDVDTSGLWKTMNIDLMTGSNFDMIRLTTVATVDGTDPSKNTFSYPCPQVAPYSTIYFYQFSSPATNNKAWTGRFAITDSVADLVAPAQSTQPDGEHISWGAGALVNGSSGAAPSAVGTGIGSSPRVVDVSASTSTAAASAAAGGSLSSTPTPGNSSPGVVPYAATPSVSIGVGISTNGAGTILATPSAAHIFSQAALALGLAAFGFTVMF